MLLTVARVLSLALLLASGHSKAEIASVSRQGNATLGLEQAVIRSLSANPELVAFGYELTAQEGEMLQASVAPNPELVVDLEDAAGTGSRDGFSSAQTTVSLRQVLERGGLQKRIAAAAAGRAVLEAELAGMRLETAAETARRFLRVLARQAELEVRMEEIEIASQAAAAVRVRVRAARSPEAELARAEIALERARLAHESTAHALLISKRQLVAMWGASDPDFERALGDLNTMPAPEPLDTLAARVRESPAMTRFASVSRLRSAELRLAEQRSKPPWQITAGIRRFEEGDDYAAVLAVAVPLTVRDRGQGTVAAARARLEQVDASRHATEVRLLNLLYELYQELQHAREVVTALDQRLLPRATDALQQTREAFEQGRYGYLDLLIAQRDRLDLRDARVKAATDAHGYASEIEFLTGALPSNAPAPNPVEPPVQGDPS